MKYKIIDTQVGGYFADGHKFKNKAEVIGQLTSYHDIDYEGEKDDGTPYENMEEFINTLPTEEEQLNFLLEWGQWELEEVK